jgi:hypothetical protein
MSYTVSTLLLRNLHEVFGEIDPVRCYEPFHAIIIDGTDPHPKTIDGTGDLDASIKASGAKPSDKQVELMRATLARYIIEQARHGELDQGRLRDGALLHLAQSNLRYPPPVWK